MAERAMDALRSYWCLAAEKEDGKPTSEPEMGLRARRERAEVGQWEAAKERQWLAAGRVNDAGYLRLRADAELREHTLEDLRGMWPTMRGDDAICVALALDALVPEDFLVKNRRLRKLIEEVVDARLQAALAQLGSVWAEADAVDAGRRAPSARRITPLAVRARPGIDREPADCSAG